MPARSFGPANSPLIDAKATRGSTKVVSPAVSAGGGLAELPPFSISGSMNTFPFGNPRYMQSCVYIVPQDVVIERIDWTLSAIIAGGGGLNFSLLVDGVAVYSSGLFTSLVNGAAVALAVTAGSRIHLRLVATNSSAINLTVMCRLAEAP